MQVFITAVELKCFSLFLFVIRKKMQGDCLTGYTYSWAKTGSYSERKINNLTQKSLRNAFSCLIEVSDELLSSVKNVLNDA